MKRSTGLLTATFCVAALLVCLTTTRTAAAPMTFAVTLSISNASGGSIGNVHVGTWGPSPGSSANNTDIAELTALADIPVGSSSIGFTVTMDPSPTVFSIAGTTAGGAVVLSYHPLTVVALSGWDLLYNPTSIGANFPEPDVAAALAASNSANISDFMFGSFFTPGWVAAFLPADLPAGSSNKLVQFSKPTEVGTVDMTVVLVPEPSSIVLAVLALVGLYACGRRRRGAG